MHPGYAQVSEMTKKKPPKHSVETHVIALVIFTGMNAFMFWFYTQISDPTILHKLVFGFAIASTIRSGFVAIGSIVKLSADKVNQYRNDITFSVLYGAFMIQLAQLIVSP